MAAPTASPNATYWNGTRGALVWRGTWTTADNFSASTLIDISALSAPAPNSIKILRVDAIINGDISVSLLFDATTDETVFIMSGQSDASNPEEHNFTDFPSGGITPTTTAAGFVGDLLITTANAASADDVTLVIVFERNS